MIKKLIFLSIVMVSFALGIHNALLYHPRHGFDGMGHIAYIEYLVKYRAIPTPNLGVETHQSPLYYIIGAVLTGLTGGWKSAQFINIFVLWMIIGMVGLAIRKVLKKPDMVFIGMFSLAALPMLNIFPAMVTNELLNTFWIISSSVSLIYIATAVKKKEIIICFLWLTASFILGMWTKMSIVLVLPTVFFTFVLLIFKNDNKKFIFGLIAGFIIMSGLLSVPIILRAKNSDSGSNIFRVVSQKYTHQYKLKPLDFYLRLDWIPKVDMYNTQYYSMLGGAWNSFWSDGHNAITPFVKFHKKAFILWGLGFILLPISLYGLRLLSKKNPRIFWIMSTLGLTMLLIYVYYNINSHYSAARLTYEMGIVIPYAFGLASASESRKLKGLLIVLLGVQFIVMVSFYWILPWWHVTK